jgi:hypothetical protein
VGYWHCVAARDLGGLSQHAKAVRPQMASGLQIRTRADLTREETLRTYVRLIGSTEPAVCYTWFSGRLWGVTPDQTPAPLVSVEGLANNVWRVGEDNVISQQNFDLGFFGDVESGDILDEFVNPFTGETVAPYHYLYGGGTSRYTEEGIQSGENISAIPPAAPYPTSCSGIR